MQVRGLERVVCDFKLAINPSWMLEQPLNHSPQTTETVMRIVSIDLGKFNSMICFYDSKSQGHSFQLASTDRRYLRKILETHPCDLVVMEACSCSGWITDLCRELGLKTLVCSTREDAWRWKNVKRKIDRDDALKLARLAACNERNARFACPFNDDYKIGDASMSPFCRYSSVGDSASRATS